MTSVSFINTNTGGGSSVLPNSQPAQPGLWLNAGVLTFWDGTVNNIMDFNTGELVDAFGNPTGVDFGV